MRCASIQERLADEGVALMQRDAAIREHVAGCADCGPFLESLERLDAGMSALAPLAAPAELIARTAEAVAGKAKSATSGGPDAGSRKLATTLAASVILAAGFGLVESVQHELEQVERVFAKQIAGTLIGDGFGLLDDDRSATRSANAPAETQARPQSVMPESEPPKAAAEAERAMDSATIPMPSAPMVESAEEIRMLESAPQLYSPSYSNERHAPVAQLSKEQKKRDRQVAGKAKKRLKSAGDIVLDANLDALATAPIAAPAPAGAGTLGEAAQLRGNRVLKQTLAREFTDEKSEADSPARAEAISELVANKPSDAEGRDDVAYRAQFAVSGQARREAGGKDKLENKVQSVIGGAFAEMTNPRQVARHFLAQGETLTGHTFQSSSGYWANTYVPGDPAIRLLEARLQNWNRGALRASLGGASLETAVRQNRQPFDLPQNAALAVYLHADKRAVDGPSRLRVQVGLRASQKRSGLRPDMNVGVVLDLRQPLDDATGAKLRALVTALSAARQPGDRFSITVAGHPGGLLVAPAAFRHGPIQVAMQSLFAPRAEARKPALDLLAALRKASEMTRASDDASAPLGASLVMLVSTAPLGEQRASLERMAHENAVAGIGLSVVAVGGGSDLASIDRLVLLGQGHRRVLAAAEDATKLVDRELHAASRAVARAVRLRIRLAPGVELIDVLGSKNLSDAAAERVREAERSIDQRLARNIGIRADRGEDEEGIQIVIPSFFAGDSHAVVLDVVVPGPGPVADVSVRYKDLVYRRNGVTRVRLAIEDGRRPPGPLERNVLKNQLAHEIARAAARAGRELAAGDGDSARRTLASVRNLMIGMRQEIPGWGNDDELRDDETRLAQYLNALGSSHAGATEQRRNLADSLRYLAFRRLVPPYK